jgi:hypothetical protein
MLLLALLSLLFSWQTAEQIPPIGIIDFYGLRTLSGGQVRQVLSFHEGDKLQGTDDELHRRVEEGEHKIEALPGVKKAKLNFTCCDAGKTTLYVGIEESGTPVTVFRAAPKGAVRLPQEIVEAGAAFQRAVTMAMAKGDAAQDDSNGYALFHNPACRAIQERFLAFAARNLPLLEDVLRNSSDAGQRALAAEVIGYAKDKRAAVSDLGQGISDSDADVRNNSMRALWLIAKFAQRSPQSHIVISTHAFVVMLNSLEWTDRNKSSLALYELTEKRDPAILTDLREHALPALIEMARWKSRGHAQAPFFLVGRIAGLDEAQIRKAWDQNDREKVIVAALLDSGAK